MGKNINVSFDGVQFTLLEKVKEATGGSWEQAILEWSGVADLPETCPECGGLVTYRVSEVTPEGPMHAIVRCAGETHLDDGTDCGYKAEWRREADA